MKIHFLYRVKKYGTWLKGELNIDKSEESDKSNLEEKIKVYLQNQYPDANKIEIASVKVIR